VPQVALAQSPPAEADSPAKAAYRAGVDHFKQRQFADAIREFNKAYRLDPNPVLVFNMARAFEELKQYDSAIEYYKKYLEMAPETPDRGKVEDSLRALEILQKAAATETKVVLTVTSVPDGAKVLVDGREVGLTPLKAEIPAGHRFLAVEAPGYTRHSSELDVVAETPPTAHVVLVPQPASSAQGPASGGGMTRDAWAYIALGLGGALLVGGGIAGWQASKKADKLDQIEANPRPSDKSQYDALKSDGKTFALVADGLFVGSALAVGTGLILLFTGQSEAPEGSPAGGTVAPAAGWSF
jgi:tetratricopeptide (TPR) repeat protein